MRTSLRILLITSLLIVYSTQQRCPQSCKICGEENFCNQCVDGYMLMERKDHCKMCSIVGCSTCDINNADKNCEKCMSGFYSTRGYPTTKCDQCIANCDVCSDSSTCKSCKSYYKFSGGKCVEDVSKIAIILGVIGGVILLIIIIIVVVCCVRKKPRQDKAEGLRNHVIAHNQFQQQQNQPQNLSLQNNMGPENYPMNQPGQQQIMFAAQPGGFGQNNMTAQPNIVPYAPPTQNLNIALVPPPLVYNNNMVPAPMNYNQMMLMNQQQNGPFQNNTQGKFQV